MEIDVSKCEYYNDYYKTCSNFSRFGDDEPYCDPKEFKCSYYVNNVEKQLQQLKAENEELRENIKLQEDILKLTIRNHNKCLDEIEEVINKCQLSNCGSCKYYYTDCTSIDKTIKNIIKQAKEGNNG